MSAPFSFHVSDHAYWRAAERFPGFRTETIEDEITSALKAKRISKDAPAGITNGTFGGSLYAWTPCGRLYVLRVHEDDPNQFAVITVMVLP